MKIKIGLISVLILTLFLATMSFASSLDEELQKLRQAGSPTTIEELNLQEIPYSENGAFFYREAFRMINDLREKYQKEWESMPYFLAKGEWEKTPDGVKKKVTNIVLHDADFDKMYRLLEKATTMKCRFYPKEDYDGYLTVNKTLAPNILPDMAAFRNCERILMSKAKIEAENGEINKSLATILTGLKIARASSLDVPVIISQLVRIAMDSIVLSALDDTNGKGTVDTALYQVLINEIEKEREDTLIYSALKNEIFIYGIQFYNTQQEQRNQELVYLKTMRQVLSITKDPYWKSYRALENIEEELKKAPPGETVMPLMLLPAISRAYLQEVRIDAYLGAAELGLANRIYRQKHGKFVDSINQLTPEILSSLPLDPFTGKDYIYRMKDEGFIVYSLGDNLKDDGGIPQFSEQGKKGDFDIVWEDNGGVK